MFARFEKGVYGVILDGPPGDGTGGAKLARRRATAADALICGGADPRHATTTRQAPAVASLVAAARAAGRSGAPVLLSKRALGDRAPSRHAFPKPFADATLALVLA